MRKEQILEELMDTEYACVIKGKGYDRYCLLEFGGINNFVQNAGKYCDLEIVDLDSSEILFDTCGTFINKVYPELSPSDRAKCRNLINKTASVLQEYIVPSDKKPFKSVIGYLEDMGIELKYHDTEVLKEMKMLC